MQHGGWASQLRESCSPAPALPMRMRVVRAATAAIRISGAVPTMVAKLWCSLSQKRW